MSNSFFFNFDESSHITEDIEIKKNDDEDTQKPLCVLNFDYDAPLRAPLTDSRLVIPGIYEGGGTIWEASLFLLSYLRERPENFQGAKNIADLGCGAAILAREALRNKQLCQLLLTDLNADVLCNVASPILRQELSESNTSSFSSSFHPNIFLVAGSWSSLIHAIQTQSCLEVDMLSESGRADLVLSSETLYRPSHLPSFCILLFELLHPTHGVALLATKRFYYGAELGGGTSAFLAAANAHNGLEATVVQTKDVGSAMILDIIRVVRREKKI